MHLSQTCHPVQICSLCLHGHLSKQNEHLAHNEKIDNNNNTLTLSECNEIYHLTSRDTYLRYISMALKLEN